jgi:citrate lyase subunit beta/citryl-CoA lyase
MQNRLRRCQLSVPGSSQKMIAKSSNLDVDVVILDLEDAVAPNQKVMARAQVVEALNSTQWKAPSVAVRINDITSEHCYADIIALASAQTAPDTLIMPKTQRATDIQFLETLLNQVEGSQSNHHPIGIEALVEDVEGMMRVEEIAACSNRLESLIFGMGDYAASQQMDLETIGESGKHYQGDLWHYPRYRLTIAARANNLSPIDGPLADFTDSQALIDDCLAIKTLGMAGKWAIHPAQIEDITSSFTPSNEAIARARFQFSEYQKATKQGQGAIEVNGVMVDAATVKLLQPLLRTADQLGL